MLIKLLVSALLLVQTSSFAATPSVRDTDTLLAFNDGAPAIDTVTPATEPETGKLIMIGLALMGVIAFRHQGVR
jgi:hypothetical protein